MYNTIRIQPHQRTFSYCVIIIFVNIVIICSSVTAGDAIVFHGTQRAKKGDELGRRKCYNANFSLIMVTKISYHYYSYNNVPSIIVPSRYNYHSIRYSTIFDTIVVVGKKEEVSINLEIQFRVVPIAICEYFLQKDHSETIPKWMVPSEQISSIFVAGLCVRLSRSPCIVHFEAISVPMVGC